LNYKPYSIKEKLNQNKNNNKKTKNKTKNKSKKIPKKSINELIFGKQKRKKRKTQKNLY